MSHLPLNVLSSPKAAGEQCSLKKRSRYLISGPPCKGMILKLDSRPSSLEKGTTAPTFCALHAPLHMLQSVSSSRLLVSSSRPLASSLGCLCPCTGRLQPYTDCTTRHHPTPEDVRAPLKVGSVPSGSPPTEIKKIN